VTVGIVMGNTGKPAMHRTAPGDWCADNHVASNKAKESPFVAKSLSKTDMLAAVAACEAYCMTDAACNFCSVDNIGGKTVTSVQWWALKQCTVNHNKKLDDAMAGDVSQKQKTGEVTITLTGPSSGYTAVGFNAGLMSDAPYTIIANSTNVWEQQIGTCGSEAEHCPGAVLKPSITLVSKSTVDGVRTVVVTRALVGISKQHYTFNSATQATIPFISAVGWSDTFEQHKVHAPAVVSLTNPAGQGATCLCDKGALAQLCEFDGSGCGAFVKNCVAEPNGDLLSQQNPTCNSNQYVGGLRCCHHNRIMLDQEQQNVSLAHDLLRYHMKWRFWFQEYKPAETEDAQPSHYDLARIYYQTEANAGEYDIPPAFALPGDPVAGYEKWPLNKPTPGTTCTGTCPGGADCECVHTIQSKFTISNQRLIYAGGHCHAPACKDIRLFRNDTGHEMELLCHQFPKYGQGNNTEPKTKEDKYDEAGYLALPPCLWGDEKGLNPSILLPANTPLVSIKRNFNTHAGHYGEMASWQMRGGSFPQWNATLAQE